MLIAIHRFDLTSIKLLGTHSSASKMRKSALVEIEKPLFILAKVVWVSYGQEKEVSRECSSSLGRTNNLFSLCFG